MGTQIRHYPIRHDPDALFSAGKIAGGEQVLAGVALDGSLITVRFESGGKLRSVERVYHPGPSQTARQKLARWQFEAGFSAAAISVKPFWADETDVGVRDLPQFMYKYLGAAPDEGDAGFIPELYEDIKQFIQSGQFVLVWCGKEFWMSRDGEITDT